MIKWFYLLIKLCNHRYNLIPENFIAPTETPDPLAVTPQVTNLISIFMNLPVPDI